MNGKHLTEDMQQQYALNPGECPDQTLTHLSECAKCREAVAEYEQLWKALRDQSAPVFEFDLAAAVIARLDSADPRVAPPRHPRQNERFLLPLIALLVALPAWFFWKTAYFVFSASSTGLAAIVLIFAGITVLFSLFKYYRKYQHVLHLLNS
ncbi:MAG TPA: hypothetical protein VGR89_13170 [Puia sp.]|nr:hypothetical protein [Puia sp.]